jgi:hypothetical protein
MRLGADPELFLKNTQGKLVSVLGKLGGTKQNPLQIIDLPKGFTLQEDNVAVELGIPPASTPNEYKAFLHTCMQRALQALPGHEFSRESAASFDMEELEHPMSWVFGCEPDFNAWTGKENVKPYCEDITLRSAGGHIHVETDVDKNSMVQAMDYYMSIPSVLMDTGEKRKQLYGKAGACRYKPYGIEHRVLSNFWIFEDKTIDWVWRNTAKAEQAVKDGTINNIQVMGDEIQRIINENDKTAAQNFINQYNLEVA